MPVFDVHIHVYPREMVRPDVRAMIEGGLAPSAIEALASVDSLLRYLDEQDVERACCIGEVSPDVLGFTRDANDWLAGFAAGHRDRLLVAGSVNPRLEADVASEIARVLDLGVSLVKIHPPHQLFAANAYRDRLPQLADIYRACEERKVPVMIHTGTSVFPGARNVYADPMPIDDVALDFPSLQIILAHAGRPLYAETAFFLARRHRNVHIDISGIPPRTLAAYFPRLPQLADKVLWGTDWPSPGVTSPKKNADDFRAIGYGPEVERKVLYDNAAKLFAVA